MGKSRTDPTINARTNVFIATFDGRKDNTRIASLTLANGPGLPIAALRLDVEKYWAARTLEPQSNPRELQWFALLYKQKE